MGVISTLISEYFLQICVLSLTLLVIAFSRSFAVTKEGEPPLVQYRIPFLGNAIEYGIDPVRFLQECQQKYGNCFTFVMLGRKMTFCLGPDGNHFVFNVPVVKATAEGAYDKLTVPVFGSGVVYDVQNAVFMEQKKFVKDAFNVSAFESYSKIIIQECREFFAGYKDFNEEVIFEEMSELTIRTASACLMGREIRSQLHSNVAKLYGDLDRGLAPINVFFRWLPLPTYIKRDRANAIMTETFRKIINQRRETGEKHQDVLNALMSATYKNGEKMSDNAIAHMMIATLMGGQHTSSTTTSWILFETARRPDVVQKILEEQSMVLTGKPDTPISELPEFGYEDLKQMHYLDCVMKEVLRLHPPIHTVMRKVEKSLEYNGFTIPAGHFLCGSQAVSQMDSTRFESPEIFEPSRFIDSVEGNGEWNYSKVNITQKSARSHFLPFGAGRHRCIGESFAYVQIKSIMALFMREFKHELKDKFPKMDYTSLIVVPEKETYLRFERRK